MNYTQIFKTSIFINKIQTVAIVNLNALKIFISAKLIEKSELTT